MLLFGLDFALLFALFVFILDFIPSVGWAIAMSIPFLYSFVQFDQTYLSFVLLICLMVPQFITGNIIEPRVMGKRLNLSSFVIILSLIFWSSLWWVAGAFLAIPLMVSINIVLSKFKATQALAVFLSQDWEIKK
jgi:predicted PurR-regulated permease PerM